MKNILITQRNKAGAEYTLEFSINPWKDSRLYLEEISGKRPVQAGYIDIARKRLVESKANVGTRIAACSIFEMWQNGELN